MGAFFDFGDAMRNFEKSKRQFSIVLVVLGAVQIAAAADSAPIQAVADTSTTAIVTPSLAPTMKNTTDTFLPNAAISALPVSVSVDSNAKDLSLTEKKSDSVISGGERHHVPSVAVMPLMPNGVDSASAKVLTDALSDELIRGGKIRVMERTQMDQILKEQGFQQSGSCDGSECAVQAGKILGIDRIVVGSVGKIGSAYVLSVRGVDVGTGEVLASARRQQVGALESVLMELLPPLSAEIGARLVSEKPVVTTSVPEVKVDTTNGGTASNVVKTQAHWGLWAVGGVALAGGAAVAAVLLGSKGASSTHDSVNPSATTNANLSWSAKLTW